MKKQSLIIALTLIAGTAMADSSVEWLKSGERDLVADRLNVDVASLPASRHAESAPIIFSWAAAEDYAGQAGVQPVSVESRQYWVDIDGQALARGIDLPTTAPGAVIRISALDAGSRLQLDPARLQLAVNGMALDQAELQDFATGAQLQEQGLAVPSDSLAFRMPRDSEAGILNVRLDGAPDSQQLVVHVFEPNSDWVAHLVAPRSNFLAGQTINLDVNLSNGKHQFGATSAQAYLVSPDASESWAVSQVRGDGSLQTSAPLSTAPAPGLYEAHVYVDQPLGDLVVRRDLKLAFSVAPAAGRFTGQISQLGTSDLSLNLGIEVAAAGRYQVNGEIYGTNAAGQLQALAFAQSAAVLEAGSGEIVLAVDQATLKGSGLSAPFEVHNLQLLDQGRMYVLEERQRAIMVQAPGNDQRRPVRNGPIER